MRSFLIVLILILFSLLFNAKGGILTVCDTCTYESLSSAIEKAQAHDTIAVKKGVYSSVDVSITFPLTIVGEPKSVLDGEGKSYILKIYADSVTLSGLTFINAGRSYTKNFAAIYLHRAKHFNISNNIVIKPFFGILIEKSHFGYISNNTVYGEYVREDDSGNGIHAWHCSNLNIEDNEVYGLRDGIYFEFVDQSTVRRNYSHDNIRYGLHYMFSNHDSYLDNTFQNNGAGVAVMFSKFITMQDNKFMENWGPSSYGLLLKEIYDAEVIRNEFRENTVAIFVEGSSRVAYSQNVFSQNGWAIKVSGGCYENEFRKNNFISNAFDVSYHSKMNDNVFEGNYWSAYAGYDLDRDGVGDVPYRPVKLFSYIVNNTPEAVVLLRSLFVDMINFSEKVSPIFTPDNLSDRRPAIHPLSL